jgi:hypothetical protein
LFLAAHKADQFLICSPYHSPLSLKRHIVKIP